MTHTTEDTTKEFDAVASRLWFEHCDMQGWPNGLPTWDELKQFTDPAWVRTRQEYEAMAGGAMEVCDHFHKRRVDGQISR